MERITNNDIEFLVGMTKEFGSKWCLDNGYKVRIIREDSAKYAITQDLLFDRVNLSVDNGVITDCHIG